MSHQSGEGASGVRIGATAMALVKQIGKAEQRTHRIVVERAMEMYAGQFYPELVKKQAAKEKSK